MGFTSFLWIIITTARPCSSSSFYSYYAFNLGLDESISQDDVLLIAHELGPLWKKVGLALKVPKAVISQIEANKPEVFDKCYTVLTSWQERYPKDATYHRLALALKHDAVGRADVAEKYCGL
ncbi:uncharacterized protein LOC122951744 [Acropora millepora]|uniref:uncharacterized protein LOC122951744 n=1 Tax=Acropora millepora TaxID=45264 RepID=UPI001CF12F1B|nr:uncharacterized protein LOC122951744 [Acropora millepora]